MGDGGALCAEMKALWYLRKVEEESELVGGAEEREPTGTSRSFLVLCQDDPV
jgi:hypothetical protein